MDEERQPGLILSQVYLESASFKHRQDFLSLPPTPAPGELDVHMAAQYLLSDDKKSGVVRLTVSTQADAKGHYEFEVTVGALLTVNEGNENLPLEEYARGNAPALLYPFAREAVANLTGRGRFGATWLHPFNFLAALAGEQSGRARLTPPSIPKQKAAEEKG